ncbi:MAG: class I SAM-dependent methyltransferase [Pseudomonadota bacterium]
MTDWQAFFEIHEGLDRQGPGLPEDVAWAIARANVPAGAHILDAGCGAGADIPALLSHGDARVTAVDTHVPFIDIVRRRFPDRVVAEAQSMADPEGPFDFIWCAGALYFLGITEGLDVFRPKLAPGAAVAFSEPVWTKDNPPEPVRAYWEEYPNLTDMTGLEARVTAAKYRIEGVRLLSPEAWDAYYTPMAERVSALRPGARPALAQQLDVAEHEHRIWRAHSDMFSYALLVVRPE